MLIVESTILICVYVYTRLFVRYLHLIQPDPRILVVILRPIIR